MLTDLPTRIKQCARDAGFDLCGIAPVRDFGELQVFPAWIADGKHGEMKYMEARDETGDLKRASLGPSRSLGAQRDRVRHQLQHRASLLDADQEDASRGWISRYAWSREDYHDSVLRRLKQVEDALRGLVEASGYWVPDTGNLHLRSYVDTGPLIERVYAKYAGIGWIGKNTCIINQQLGSWLFLGVILTSLDLTDDSITPTCPRPIVAGPAPAASPPVRRRRLLRPANWTPGCAFPI